MHLLATAALARRILIASETIRAARMKRLAAVFATLITLSACGVDRAPSPVSSPHGIPPTPTASPTPSQAELSAEAERVYRTFFAEWKRLELAGGADEPTQILRDNGDGSYLRNVMELLQRQRASGKQILGPATTTRVKPTPGGDYDGVDPRLTLQVCEDGSAGTYIHDGKTGRGYPVEGKVYFGYVDGRIKVVAGSTRKVERCSF